MSKNSGVSDFAGMEGKTILLGKGSFGAKEGAKYLKMFGLEGKVTLAEVELSNAVPALKNGQIDGFVTAGSFPAPNVIEAAASAGATVISLNEDQVKQSKRTRLVIPANTYAGQSADIVTTISAGGRICNHRHGQRHSLCLDQNLLGKQRRAWRRGTVVERRVYGHAEQHSHRNSSGCDSLL